MQLGVGRAHGQEQPGALEVREPGQLLQQVALFACSGRCPGTHVLRVAEGRAQHKQAAFRQGPVPTPHVRAQLGHSGWRRAPCRAVDTGFAHIGSDAALVFNAVNHHIVALPGTVPIGDDVEVVKKREEALGRCEGRGRAAQGTMLAERVQGAGQQISLLAALALRNLSALDGRVPSEVRGRVAIPHAHKRDQRGMPRNDRGSRSEQ